MLVHVVQFLLMALALADEGIPLSLQLLNLLIVSGYLPPVSNSIHPIPSAMSRWPASLVCSVFMRICAIALPSPIH